MGRALDSHLNDESGFTLVELLIVMLVLGLLAAIAIPAFLSQRDKARDAEAKAAVRTAQTASEVIAVENDGAYDGANGVTVANVRVIEPTLNDANLSVPAVAADTFTVRVTSGTGNRFEVARAADGSTTFSCMTAGGGGCPADGFWN